MSDSFIPFRSMTALSILVQELMLIDAGLQENLEPIPYWIAQELGCVDVCLAIFLDDGGMAIGCSSRRWANRERCAAFVREIAAPGFPLLDSSALADRMTPELRDYFSFLAPWAVPIKLEGELYGALWCDAPDTPLSHSATQDFLYGISNVLAVSLHNARHYRRHIRQEQAMMQLLDNLDANIYVADPASRTVLFVNRKLREAYRVSDTPGDLKCWELMRQDHSGVRCKDCPLDALFRGEIAVHTWEEYNSHQTRYYRNTDSFIDWSGGKKVHLHYAVDITHEKQVQQNLMDAKLAADSANRAKSDFLSRMSHELRTPLNAIIGMTKIAEKSAGEPDKIQKCLATVADSAKQLTGLVNDILDVSKIQTYGLTLGREPFDLSHLMEEAMASIHEAAEQKRLHLQFCLEPGTPRYYRGDARRLSQVFFNLLSNAVKFTPENGRVHVSIREKERLGRHSVLEAGVADSGIGIAEEHRSRLFTSFEQADGGSARHYGGVGLGLVICKSIVEMMDGSIAVTSKPGEGSTFTFTAKLELLDEPFTVTFSKKENLRSAHTRPADKGSFNGYVALCACGPENLDFLRRELASFGMEADYIQNGQEMLELFRRKPDRYDIILMDADMPPPGGVEAAYFIRTLPEKWAEEIPILAFAPAASGKKLREGPAFGINDYITKPVEPQTLHYRIAKLLTRPPRSLRAPARKERAPEHDTPQRGKINMSQYINWQDGLSRVRGNKKLYATLLQSFQKGEHFAKLWEDIEKKDYAGGVASAHTVKGLAANLSMTALQEAAALIESQMKGGMLLDASVAQLRDVYQQTLEAIPIAIGEMNNSEVGE